MMRKKICIEFSTSNDEIAKQNEQKLFGLIDNILKNTLPCEAESKIYTLPQNDEDSIMDRLSVIENSLEQLKPNHRIILKTSEKHILINSADIIRLQADNSYTIIYFHQKPPIIVSRSIKYFEGLLCSQRFIRIHRSHIINIDKVIEYIKTDGSIVMNNGDRVSISHKKKELFFKMLYT